MKSKQFLYFKNKTWHPSSFWDQSHNLVWVFDYKLFKKVYHNKCTTTSPTILYAIHKDVYQAFYEKMQREKHKKTRKNKKE